MRNLGFAWLNDGLIKMSQSPNGIKFRYECFHFQRKVSSECPSLS